MNTLILLTTKILLSVNPPTPTQTNKNTLHPKNYSKRFTNVPFKNNVDKVLTHLNQITTQHFSKQITQTNNDPHTRDHLQTKITVALQQIHNNNITFTNQNTKYNISIINKKFTHNNNKSMTIIPLKHSHNYFFFIKKNNLWKIITTNVSKQRFTVFLLQQTQRFDPTKEIKYDNPSTQKRPIRTQ